MKLALVALVLIPVLSVADEEKKDYRDVSTVDGIRILATKTESEFLCWVSIDLQKAFSGPWTTEARVKVIRALPTKEPFATSLRVKREDTHSPTLTVSFPLAEASNVSFELYLGGRDFSSKTVKFSDLIEGRQLTHPNSF